MGRVIARGRRFKGLAVFNLHRVLVAVGLVMFLGCTDSPETRSLERDVSLTHEWRGVALSGHVRASRRWNGLLIRVPEGTSQLGSGFKAPGTTTVSVEAEVVGESGARYTLTDSFHLTYSGGRDKFVAIGSSKLPTQGRFREVLIRSSSEATVPEILWHSFDPE